MKNSVLPLMLIFTAFIFQRCQHTNQSTETGDAKVIDTTKISGREKLENEIQTAIFIETVATRLMFKVTLGKLAAEKARTLGVRSFGNLIVRDFKEMNEALKSLAIAKGLKPEVSLSKNDLEQVQQLTEMEPVYLEKLYMKMMIEDYNKDIELFEGARNSPDTVVSNFARKFLPVLEIHRENAVKVRNAIP